MTHGRMEEWQNECLSVSAFNLFLGPVSDTDLNVLLNVMVIKLSLSPVSSTNWLHPPDLNVMVIICF